MELAPTGAVFGSTRVVSEAAEAAPLEVADAGEDTVRRAGPRLLDAALVRGRVGSDLVPADLRAVVFLVVERLAGARLAVEADDADFARPDAALVRLAVAFLPVAAFFAVVALLAVPAFLAVDALRAVVFFAVDFRALVDFFAADFLAVDFFAVADLRVDAFLAVDLRAVEPRAVPPPDPEPPTAFAATFIAFAASAIALVAVVIALVIAVMAFTEAFALVATDFIFVAADLACVAALVTFLAAAAVPRDGAAAALRRVPAVRFAAVEDDPRFAVVLPAVDFLAAVVRVPFRDGPDPADARRVPVAFLAAVPRDADVRLPVAARPAVLRAVPVRAVTVDLAAVDFAAALVRFGADRFAVVALVFLAVVFARPAVLRLEVVRDVVLVGT
ncbi:hypothetical protein [Actinomadura gamaensis]|uniref:Uncharacterized protein n=1 Tax=Actinomadura gamaensis TaxID=1763541 RepID=A0ABV9U630_9ACTN